MTREFKFRGEMFLLDDSKGCYAEVTYKDQVGYMGVNLQGTPDAPYCWYPEHPNVLAPDGLKFGNSAGSDEESNLRALCGDLLRRHREAEARKAFKPEEACKSLHEFVESLP